MAKSETRKQIGYRVPLVGCRCRCGHEWIPRDMTERPSVCPRCKAPRWDKEKLFERPTRVDRRKTL